MESTCDDYRASGWAWHFVYRPRGDGVSIKEWLK